MILKAGIVSSVCSVGKNIIVISKIRASEAIEEKICILSLKCQFYFLERKVEIVEHFQETVGKCRKARKKRKKRTYLKA